MKKIINILLFSLLFLFVGCGDLEQPSNEKIKGGEIIANIPSQVIKQTLIGAKTPNIDENSTIFGYKAYKIPYTTTDEKGQSIKVSGLMVVPTLSGFPEEMEQFINSKGFSVVSDDHGTIFANKEAPTEAVKLDNSASGSSIILTSIGGFVTLQADYIGFGDSNSHYHPFVLKKSLANATVDFIKEARKFAKNNEINLNEQLFLTGYSEGGYASMATLQKIEEEDLNLTVTLTAPMAGPYAFSIMAKGVLSTPILDVPSFMANVGYAYAKTYNIALDEIINDAFSAELPSLFDGGLVREDIDVQLTTKTTGEEGLFKSSFVEAFFADTTDSNHWFKLKTKENDLHNWKPKGVVKLIHCLGDDVIRFDIAKLTLETMLGMGATSVEIVPVEVALTKNPNTLLRYKHAECAPIAYGVATEIFSQVRKATKGY